MLELLRWLLRREPKCLYGRRCVGRGCYGCSDPGPGPGPGPRGGGKSSVGPAILDLLVTEIDVERGIG